MKVSQREFLLCMIISSKDSNKNVLTDSMDSHVVVSIKDPKKNGKHSP